MLIALTLTFNFLLLIFAHSCQSPLLLALVLVLFAGAQALTAWVLLSKWLSLAIFLVFVGGMMISFLYVTSLVNNPKTLTSQLFYVTLSLAGLTWLSFLTIELNLTPLTSSLFSAYQTPGFLVLLFMIFYLLLVLFIVVKLVENFKGALVQKL